MAYESKQQQIQRRLNVEEMDHGERTEMFNKLKKAGGQVIDLDRENQKEHTSSTPKTTPKPASRPSSKPIMMRRPQPKPAPKETNTKKDDKTKVDTPKQKYPSGMQVMGYRINLFLSWIFDFSGKRFRPRYISLVMSEYQNTALSISTILAPLYNESTEAHEFKNRMYANGSLLEYELGYYFYHIFDAQKFGDLQRPISQGVQPAKNHIKDLFAPLHRLRSHNTHTKVVVANLLRRFTELFPSKTPKLDQTRQISKWMSVIWDKFFLETNQLILYYWTEDCHRNKLMISIDEYLGVDTLPRIGALAEEWETAFKTQEIIDADTQSTEGSEGGSEEEAELISAYPTESIEEGMEFIVRNISFEERLQGYQSGTDLRALFRGDDKLFFTYGIIDFFDAEFSTLWAGNNVNFYVVNDRSGVRYDPKKELIILNGRINQFYEQVNEYLRQLRSFKGLRDSSTTGTQRLVQLENKEKDLVYISTAARTTATKLVEEYIIHISRVLASVEATEPLVSNWKEELPTVKSQRKVLSGVHVIDAFTMVSHYLDATLWLLTKSDLSGRSSALIKPEILSIIQAPPKKNA